MKICFVSIIFYFFCYTSSYAYIDPGSGSFIIQAILAFLAAIVSTASFYWSKIKFFIKKKFKKKEDL
jgi:hypothetical protein